MKMYFGGRVSFAAQDRGLVMAAVLAIALLTFSFGTLAETSQIRQSSDSLEELYHHAQREFVRANYPLALEYMEQFIERSKTDKVSSEQLIIMIDRVGFVYLRVRHDPVKAIAFFKKIEKELEFSEEISNVIEEWLGAAIEWQQFGTLPDDVKSPDKLFALGKSYFDKGEAKLHYPMDKSGNANFHIAASYLIPFIAQYDNHERIADALLMMGRIRRHITLDPEYWTENFYLKEVIRRFPHTDVAQQAYQALEESVHFGYSGSGGDSTPPSMVRMLEEYKSLAGPVPK
ncbi:MAG: hypothetical protein AMJ55_04660 [Gammaproteobacteria bacterium SG8_15]|nr:MAG: hypothetical protein AMJ55_04660 [Gammaproteobacteria bacterium SG8_15]